MTDLELAVMGLLALGPMSMEAMLNRLNFGRADRVSLGRLESTVEALVAGGRVVPYGPTRFALIVGDPEL